MRFTLSWLARHLDFDADLATITERLTMLGLEVEKVVDRAADLAPFTVARVIEARPHPDADRLQVCRVETAGGEVEVVCGAPNARTGLVGVFAAAGTIIPGTGLHLKKSKIRGVESNGMLCSEREMGLSDAHEGIIELPEGTTVGTPFAEILGLDDPMIEVQITPDRADCLGVAGIARDLAAAGLGRLKPFDTTPLAGTFASPTAWRRDLPADAADACPFVAGRTFRNLRNGPSPEWAQQRLKAIGLRPISALVDITNLLTYDLGRPLHVFDAGKIRGDLTMRLAQDGEEVLALDGRTYRLDDGAIVIADQTGVHGIGGIMGGAGSGCSETTTEAFLEVALFDPVRVAATGRRLGIESDARYRFERGVDPQSAVWGAEVAARLILEWCGGEASQVVTAGTLPQPEQVVSLRGDRVATLGGGDVPAADQARILTSLGFDAAETKPDATAWRVPSWRSDIDGEADLVEEVLRVWGLDRITPVSVVPGGSIPGPAVTAEQRRLQVLRRVLAARGLYEAVTWSFTGQAQALTFGGGAAALRLVNPISADLDAMRPSLLVNLLAATGRNLARGQGDFGLFEVGPQYGVAGSDNDLMAGQMTAASGVRCGVMDGGWAARPRPVDLYDAKADALAALEALGAPVASLQTRREAPAWYHPGRSAVLALGPQVLAAFGDIHPDVAAAFDLAVPATLFEVYADRVPGPRRAKTASGAARPPLALSPYQPVTRDFAFVVAADVAAESLIRAARGADRDLISEVRLFDVYQGAELGDGKVSLAIAVTLQPMTATLTDKEIEAVAARVVAAVEKATGGRLRR